MQTCSKCGMSLPLSEFYTRKDGRRNLRCKTCVKAYTTAWRKTTEPERLRDHRVRYYQKHRDKCIARDRAYYQEHKDEVLARQRAAYHAKRMIC